MKTTILALGIALVTSVAFSQEVSRSTSTTVSGDGVSTTRTATSTTTSMGTIHEYSPGTTFVVKETSGPVTYRYGKKVVYVTKAGKTLSDDEVKTRIKVGAPVHVHYSTEGENRIVDRVEVDED